MANCSKFMALSEVEKVIFAAELLHVAQSDDVLFERAKNLIQSGYKRGAFKGVKIMPNNAELWQGEEGVNGINGDNSLGNVLK